MSENKGQVYFVNSFLQGEEEVVERSECPVLLIKPNINSWDDFGYQLIYEFNYYNENNDKKYNDIVYLGFPDGNKSHHRRRFFDETDTAIIAIESLPPFYSILKDINSYRRVVEALGPNDAQFMLSLMNDLVLLRKKASKDLSVVENTELFQLGLMRETERFFAYYNASPILDGLVYESKSDFSEPLVLNFTVGANKEEHSLYFKFSNDKLLPRRVNILIGKNGLGKSRALFSLVKSLQKADGNFRTKSGSRPNLNRLVAVGTPGETGNTFPRSIKSSRVHYQKLSIGRNVRGQNQGLGSLFKQISRSQDKVLNQTKLNIFRKAILQVETPDNIFFEVKKLTSSSQHNIQVINEKFYISVYSIDRCGEQATLEIVHSIADSAKPLRLHDSQLIPFSSGELAFIQLCLQISLLIDNGTLVLMDEPETHLHPNYISEFMKVFNQLLEDTGSYGIIATHSAYLVREVPSQQVSIFKHFDDRSLSILNPTLNTFGADIGSLSYFIFDDDIVSVLADDLITKLSRFDKKTAVDKLKSIEKELSPSLTMHLLKELGLREMYEEIE